jgi:hypothetical protein
VIKGHSKLIFDTRHRLNGANVEHL